MTPLLLNALESKWMILVIFIIAPIIYPIIMKRLMILTLFFSLFSYAGIESSPNPVTAEMQKLYQSLSEVLTYSSSGERFSDPSHQSKIADQLKNLSNSAHTVKNTTFSGDKTDPTLSVLSNYLNEETKAAYLSFKNGKKEYARSLVRSLPGTCFACHSRNGTGPQFEKLNLEPTDALLKPIEKAEFYAATRQFDRAQKEFMSIIENQQIASSEPYSWEHAVRQSLVISVRVKRDANLAKKVIESALTQKKAAYTTREDLNQWKKSVEKWIKEIKATPKTEKGLYSEGMRLIGEAHQIQKYPMDHSADILYLRASSIFYDLIQMAPNGKTVSEALMMEGICNEILSPRGFEDLHRYYYESCIKKSPHSSIAMDCYRRYERSTIQGYTGSAGIAVPEEIKQKLLDLFSLSVSKTTENQIY